MNEIPPQQEVNKSSPDGLLDTRYLILPLWIVAIYALGWLMHEAAPIFLWVVSSFFLFVVLDPVTEYLKRHRWPTALAAVVPILLVTAIMVGTVFVLGHLFSAVVVELEKSKQLFVHTVDSLSSSLNLWRAQLSDLNPGVADHSDVTKVEIVQGSPLGSGIGGSLLHGLGSVTSILTFSLLVPILAFFFLAERDGFGRMFVRVFEDPEKSRNAWKKTVESTQAFFFGNFALGLITFPVFVFVFWCFSLPSLLPIAILATFFNLIPFAGAVASGFLPAVILYAQTESLAGVLWLYASCVAIHFVIADFVTPKILGSKVNINATVSILAMVAWGELWGPVGLILAIPMTSLLKNLFENSQFEWLHWIAGVMSEASDSALKPPALRKK